MTISPRMPAPDRLRPAARSRWHARFGKYAEALSAWSQRIAARLLIWRERTRQRRALRAMSAHMLKDLGISHADAGRESGKRFWEL